MTYTRRSHARRTMPPGDLDDPFSIACAIVDYLDYLEARNYSPATVEAQSVRLAQFCAWAAERDVLRYGEVDATVLESYQRYLSLRRKDDGEPLQYSTQLSMMSPVLRLFRNLARTGKMSANPASAIEMPRRTRRLPRGALSVTEAEAVLAVPDITSPYGLRDRAILEVLYATGIRRSELVHLRLPDLDVERATLFVCQGKGNKDRYVPLGERANTWLWRYLNESRPLLAFDSRSPALFVTYKGGPITAGSLSEIVSGYIRESGISRKGSCHIFRHTAATLMIEGGADTRFVQELLGHSDLNSTQVYTHVSIAKLAQVHAATHPGARLARPSRNPTDI